jgi:hypothetical protein
MRAAFALDGELVDHLGVDLDLFAEPPVLVGELLVVRFGVDRAGVRPGTGRRRERRWFR